MNHTAKRYMEIVRYGYLSLLTVYAVLREVMPLQAFIGNTYFAYAFFAVGAGLIGADLVRNRSHLNARYIGLLIAFLGVCGVTSVLHFRYDFMSNLKAIGWMAIYFFLVYPCGSRDGLGSSRGITVVFTAAVITFAVLVLGSLPMYFYGVDYAYINGTAVGVASNQGFSHEYMRLWGVFKDANYAAIYTIVAMLASVYLFVRNRKPVIRVLLVLADVVFAGFVVLTGSRTARYVLMLVCGWIAFYAVSTKWAGKGIKRIALSAGGCLLAAVLAYAACVGINFAMPYVKSAVLSVSGEGTVQSIHGVYDTIYRHSDLDVISGYLDADAQEQPAAEPEPDGSGSDTAKTPQEEIERLQRNDLEQKSDISNGRFSKWEDAVEIFRASPWLGTSPRGMSSFAKEHCPETNIAKYGYSTHSFVLEILTGTGLLGFLIAMTFLGLTAANGLTAAFEKPYSVKYQLFSAMALALAAASMLESDLFFILTFGGVMFWLALGAMNSRT